MTIYDIVYLTLLKKLKKDHNMLYKDVPNAYKWGYKEALRLNRLNAHLYKCYRDAIKARVLGLPVKLTKQQKKQALEHQQALASQRSITAKDKKDAVIDDLTNLTHYTYDSIDTATTKQVRKAYVSKLVSNALNADKPVGHCPTPLTQERLQSILYYDAGLGVFEWQVNTKAGKEVLFTRNADKAEKDRRKPLRKQQEYNLPIKARSYKPSHAGYKVITEQEYVDTLAGAKNKQTTWVDVKGMFKKTDTSMEHVHKRYYLVRTRKERGKPAPLEATERVAYYIKSIDETNANPNLKISILGTSYPVVWLATLYMGAGGDWDYTKGIDNIRRNPDHIMTAPHGLRQYNPKTNKPMQTKPRDGDYYNLKWDNIKPDHVDRTTIDTIAILKDPQAAKLPLYKQQKQYNYTRNIKKVYLAYDQMNPRYILERMGGGAFTGWTYEEAQQEFDRRITKMKGTKQKLRNGDIMVTRMVSMKH